MCVKRVCHPVRTCLTLCVAFALAVHHEHIFFLVHSSIYHDTRTHTHCNRDNTIYSRTPSTSSTSPRPPSRQATPSRTTLTWKPAEWRKPAQNILHKLRDQRTCDQGDCDRLKDLEDNRYKSVKWCTGKFWRAKSPSSDYRRREIFR